MATFPLITESNSNSRKIAGQKNNQIVLASDFNKVVTRLNSISTDDNSLTISGNEVVGGNSTITGNLAVTGTANITGALNYKSQVTDTNGAFATPIALTEAQSGRVILIDDAAGLDFTLPAVTASNIGIKYEFLVTTTITSNSFRVTAQAGDFLNGAVFNVDFDTANTGSYFTANGSTHLVCTMNGSTQGGKKGTKVTFIAISATGWWVDGLVFGDGVLATPFS